jgi:hypothetical protein
VLRPTEHVHYCGDNEHEVNYTTSADICGGPKSGFIFLYFMFGALGSVLAVALLVTMKRKGFFDNWRTNCSDCEGVIVISICLLLLLPATLFTLGGICATYLPVQLVRCSPAPPPSPPSLPSPPPQPPAPPCSSHYDCVCGSYCSLSATCSEFPWKMAMNAQGDDVKSTYCADNDVLPALERCPLMDKCGPGGVAIDNTTHLQLSNPARYLNEQCALGGKGTRMDGRYLSLSSSCMLMVVIYSLSCFLPLLKGLYKSLRIQARKEDNSASGMPTTRERIAHMAFSTALDAAISKVEQPAILGEPTSWSRDEPSPPPPSRWGCPS